MRILPLIAIGTFCLVARNVYAGHAGSDEEGGGGEEESEEERPEYNYKLKVKGNIESRPMICADLTADELNKQDEDALSDMSAECFHKLKLEAIGGIKKINMLSLDIIHSMTATKLGAFNEKALIDMNAEYVAELSMDIGIDKPQHGCKAFRGHPELVLRLKQLASMTPECIHAIGSPTMFKIATKIGKDGPENILAEATDADLRAAPAAVLKKVVLSDAQLQKMGTESDTNICTNLDAARLQAFPRFIENMSPSCLEATGVLRQFNEAMIKRANPAAFENVSYNDARAVNVKVVNAMPLEVLLVFFKDERCRLLEQPRFRNSLKPEVHAGLINCASQMPEGFVWNRPSPQAAVAVAVEPAATTAAPESESSATSIATSLASMAVCAAMAVAVAA